MKNIAVLFISVLLISGCGSALKRTLVDLPISSAEKEDGSPEHTFTQYSGVKADATSSGQAILIAVCSIGDDGTPEYTLTLAHFTLSDAPAVERTPTRAVFRVDGNDSYEIVDTDSLVTLGRDGDSHMAVWSGSNSDVGQALFNEFSTGQDLKASFEMGDDLIYNYTVYLDLFEEDLPRFVGICDEL